MERETPRPYFARSELDSSEDPSYFQGEIDAADHGNPIDRRLGPMDNALSDDLRSDGADDEHHAKQQQDAEAWSVGLDLSSDEIEQSEQGFEQGHGIRNVVYAGTSTMSPVRKMRLSRCEEVVDSGDDARVPTEQVTISDGEPFWYLLDLPLHLTILRVTLASPRRVRLRA